MNEALSPYYPPQLVPADYAEKAMASLMQLHSELMDEKERRVDLFRRLMEREQAVAELKMYVKVLEERLAAQAPPRAVTAEAVEPPPQPPQSFGQVQPRVQASAQVRPPVPPRVNANGARRPEGWKVW